MKRENLTKTESQKLHDFAAECVMSNVTFPPIQMGGSSVTIQDLLHGRSVDSLAKYAEFLETQGGKISRLEKINGVKEKTISGSDITYAEAVEAIDLIIKHKLAAEQAAKVAQTRIELQKELDSMKTPKERRAEIEAKLASLPKV